MEQRVIQPQYQIWIAKLLGYSFEVVYKPGVENSAADALSRKPAEIRLWALSIPVTKDLEVIRREVPQDPKLQKIIEKVSEQDDQSENKYTAEWVPTVQRQVRYY